MVIRLFGVSAADMRNRLSELEKPAFKVSVEETALDCRVELSGKRPEEEISDFAARLVYPFGLNVYAFEDKTLPECLFELLQTYRLRISFAESLTGGALTSSMVDLAGVSKYLYEGIVAYDSVAKVRRLGVAESTLRKHTAVSYETATEMVEGLFGADIDVAVSTTGYAGSGGDEANPAGTFFVGVGTRERVDAYRFFVPSDRNTTRGAAVNAALFCVVKTLRGEVLDLKLFEEQLQG